MYLPPRIRVSSLRPAKDLRTQLTDTWTPSQSDIIILFRACVAIVIMSTFFVAGKQELSAGMETYCVHRQVG
jgi:hypothetical protein